LQYSEWILKLWYLSGAMLTAAWLGQGSIHLMVRKPHVASILTGILTLASLASIGLSFATPVNSLVPYVTGVAASAQYQAILGRNSGVLLMTILLNSYGTLTLVGCALFSAYIFWRKHVLLNRMVGNILITLGALAPAIGGTFVKLGVVNLLYLSEFVGVVVMFVGFLQATAKSVPSSAQSQQVLAK
jgi:hypothetical protein